MADQRVRPSRVDKVLIAGHFSREVSKQLKIGAAEKETTVQALLGRGIAKVLAEIGRPVPADLLEQSGVELPVQTENPAPARKTRRVREAAE